MNGRAKGERGALEPLGSLPVSLFERVDRPDPAGTAAVAVVLRGIRSGRWAAAVAAVRGARTKEERQARKRRRLPAVTFSGTFARRTSDALEAHSGLVCLDFDDIEDPVSFRNTLGQHPHVAAAFLSVSGTGVKALVPVVIEVDGEVEADGEDTGAYRVPVDDAEHKTACDAVFALFDHDGLDRACRDVARLCFVSHDPDLVANAEAVPVVVAPPAEGPAERGAARSAAPPKHPAQGADSARTVDPVRAAGPAEIERVRSALAALPPRPDYATWVKVIAGVLAAAGDAATAERLLRAWSPEEEPGEYARKLRHPLDRVSAGTLFWLARQHGWTDPAVRPRGSRDEASAAAPAPNASVEAVAPHAALHMEAGTSEAEGLPWRPFPVGTLPAAVRAYVVASAAAIGVDVAAVAVPALAVLAAAVGNSFRLRLKASWAEPATLWACVVMPSGAAKSPAWAAALRPVFALERERRADHAQAMEAYEAERRAYEALSKRARAEQPPPTRPEAPRVRVADTTVEGVVQVHGANPRGLLLARDELAGWIASFDRYSRGGGDLQAWIELHDGRGVVVDRKTGEPPTLHVDRPAVSVVGTTQPAVLREGLTPEHFTSGFAPRLVLCAPPARPRGWSEADVTPAVGAGYERLVRRLYALPHEAGEVVLSAEAKRHFVGWVDRNGAELHRLPDGPLRSACAKLEARVARLALLFALAEAVEAGAVPRDGLAVSAEAMARAVRLTLWLRYETARLYGAYGFERRAVSADVQRVRGLPETFGWREVAAAWGIQKAGAYKALRRLIEQGYVEDAGRGVYRRLLPAATGVGDGGPVDFGDFGAYGEPLVSEVSSSTVSGGATDPISRDPAKASASNANGAPVPSRPGGDGAPLPAPEVPSELGAVDPARLAFDTPPF